MTADATKLPSDFLLAAHRLIEANRLSCLWFLRPDYLPRSAREVETVLAQIEARGDRQAWAEARMLRTWLSRNTSAAY